MSDSKSDIVKVIGLIVEKTILSRRGSWEDNSRGEIVCHFVLISISTIILA